MNSYVVVVTGSMTVWRSLSLLVFLLHTVHLTWSSLHRARDALRGCIPTQLRDNSFAEILLVGSFAHIKLRFAWNFIGTFFFIDIFFRMILLQTAGWFSCLRLWLEQTTHARLTFKHSCYYSWMNIVFSNLRFSVFWSSQGHMQLGHSSSRSHCKQDRARQVPFNSICFCILSTWALLVCCPYCFLSESFRNGVNTRVNKTPTLHTAKLAKLRG